MEIISVVQEVLGQGKKAVDLDAFLLGDGLDDDEYESGEEEEEFEGFVDYTAAA